MTAADTKANVSTIGRSDSSLNKETYLAVATHTHSLCMSRVLQLAVFTGTKTAVF